MPMTPDAKSSLSKTIRELRTQLLDELEGAMRGDYQLSLHADKATLSEAQRKKRARLDGWVDEQLRSLGNKTDKKAATARFRRDIATEAAYTLLNRLVYLRLLEAAGLRKAPVVTGGWRARGYRDFRDLAPALIDDDTEGYATVLGVVFDELALDLPGLFGRERLSELIRVPAAALRRVVEALDEPALASCWTDEMTLGWIYQYWNDPEREALDDKLNAGGKIAPHEIASKTQMFTERYIVDWLLQNSLGPLWLAMCKRHGWTPEAEADGTLAGLEARRVEWREKRAAGEVSLSELMPLRADAAGATAERRWAYYVPQPIPADAVASAPDSLRDVKILDPAVGSGHFLVVALDLLVGLYREEARHRGEAGEPRWSDRAIVEHILAHNLYGIDLDPRAVQIAAAALWLEAQKIAPGAEPPSLHLVASNLRLASLPDDDPALVELRREIERATGIPGALTDRIVHALKGADHLGSLLQVDAAVNAAVDAHERRPQGKKGEQGDIFSKFEPRGQQELSLAEVRASVTTELEQFLAQRSGSDDLGLRLRGEQLTAGIRFARMVQPDQYDLVVGNPPYQGTSKMADAKYVKETYPLGKADLYAAFLERGLQLAREGGMSALLTMRNWMFIKQYAELRTWLLETWDLRGLGDFDRGAFEEVPDEVVSVVGSVYRKAAGAEVPAVAVQPTSPDDTSRDAGRTTRKRAAALCHAGRHEFEPAALNVVPEWPLVYWWTPDFLTRYAKADLLGTAAPIRYGLSTQNNVRWLRNPWEVERRATMIRGFNEPRGWDGSAWVPYTKGAAGTAWIDSVSDVLLWRLAGAELWAYPENRWGRGTDYYFHQGVAFVNIGARFSARVHRMQGIFGHVAGSVFNLPTAETVCLLNSAQARYVMESLNPTLHFLTSDVERIPLVTTTCADDIYHCLDARFGEHESHREPSVEFKRPGPSPWRHAQVWAQAAVDRPEGAPLPEYVAELDPEPATDHVSFALGVALGRFGPNGEGILDPGKDDLGHALPAGLLFLDGTLHADDTADGLGHAAAQPLHAAWREHGPIDAKRPHLRDYLRLDFFGEVHRAMYENRPIHWPLSSEKKTFVAWVNIHRFDGRTLRTLLAEHLNPTLTRLEGQLADLRTVRDGADKAAARQAEKRFGKLQKAREELARFVALVSQCAEQGPRAPTPKTTPRETNAPYDPHLDDGVMINSAALWPLLLPQWKDPKKWYQELAAADGRKDYDWSHLAARYWPQRVDAKCQADPSLGVAHGCFWRYHPARAYAWELRLQDEIAPDFTIDEPDADACRKRFLAEHPEDAAAIREKEAKRRQRNATKAENDPAASEQPTLLTAGPATATPATATPKAKATAKNAHADA